MKKTVKYKIMCVAACVMLLMSTTAFGAAYNNPDPGTPEIYPEDTLTLPDNTSWATLTASWAVRVIFLDYDETELQNELFTISDSVKGETTAPPNPARDGYTFMGWERYDTNSGPAALHDDGSVTGIDGPGPIIFIAVYEKIPYGSPTPDDSTPGTPDVQDEPAQETGSSKTGDDSAPWLWIALLALSGTGALVCFRKRKNA